MLSIRNLFMIAATLVAATFCLSKPLVAQDAERIETLFERLSDPEAPDWESVAENIMEEWAKSGSRTITYLHQRGVEALEADDLPAAREHLSAAIDHAPEFGQAYFARGNVYYQMGELGLSLEDFTRAVALIPKHFEAYHGIGAILEQMDELDAAFKAYKFSWSLNPHGAELKAALERLEAKIDGRDT
jgi:tetratricopeptide (TPR) repeat protein